MENPEISVIIPIYNTEKFLKQCLDSVINQTFENIEIICINDGSTDNSPKILNKYAKKDKRIRIINEENQGPGESRNNGINIAKGKYICFVDSDDWVNKDYCKKLRLAAEKFNSDMVMCREKLYYCKQKKLKKNEFYKFPAIKGLKNRKVTWKGIRKSLFVINPSAWGKIYRTDFLKKTGARFPKGLWFEDNPFYLETTLSAKKMIFLNNSLYFYRKEVKNSITNNDEKKALDIIKISSICKDILKKHRIYNKVKKEFLTWMIDHYFLKLYIGINNKHKKIAFYQFKRYLLKQKINTNNLTNKTKKAYNFFINPKSSENFKKIILPGDKFIGQVGLVIRKINPKVYYKLGGKN
jgi:glycosyltransferase involved in cell wall biosynthesis